MRSAITLGLGILVATAAPGLRAQAKPSTSSSAKAAQQDAGKPAQQTAKPATTAPTKPTPQAAKPAAPAPSKPATPAAKPAAQGTKPAGTPAAKSGAKPATKAGGKAKAARPARKPVEKPSTPGSKPAAAESEIKQARRDPFESLVGRQNKGGTPNLPPGKLGLQVSTLRLDGIVRSPNGMIAVVSNPQSRTYFLREGDRLYDGSVEKISMDSVSFHEEGKDAFGKPVERQVNKRIYSSPGELQ
jgi:Tfp pilus assembly protein PilP